MKQLPPIFKVSNNIKDTNQKYYYEKVTNKIKLKKQKKLLIIIYQ